MKGRTRCQRPLRSGRHGSGSPWLGGGLGRRNAPLCAEAGSRGQEPRHCTRSGNSPCHAAQAMGAQSLGENRATEEEPRQPEAERGARASLPAAPAIAPGPSRVDGGLGGSRLALAAPAARDAPTRRQPAGGQRPGAQAAGAGNPVESRKARPSAKPKPAARPATGARGFPARGAVRVADCGRHGAPSPLGHGRRPDARIAGRASRPGKGDVGPQLHGSCSYPPFTSRRIGRRMGAGSYTGYLHREEITHGEP